MILILIRKNYNLLRSSASEDNPEQFKPNGNYFQDFCQPILFSLNFIKRYCAFILNRQASHHESIFRFIQSEMKSLIMFVGRLWHFRAKFQEFSFDRKSDFETPFFHHFHLTLQIWWSLLEISWLSKRSQWFNCNRSQDSSIDFFKETSQILIYDLLLFSSVNFQEDNLQESSMNLNSIVPFKCTCFLEIFTMLKLFYCHSEESSEPFTSLIFEILCFFDANKLNETNRTIQIDQIQLEYFKLIQCNDFRVKEFNQFVLWLWLNLVPLFNISIDESGKLCHNRLLNLQTPINIVKIFQSIFKEIDSQSTTKSEDEKNRLILILLQLLIKTDRFSNECNTEIVILFLDFYLKRLNSSFSSTNTMFDDYLMTIKNGHQWSNDINSLTSLKILPKNEPFNIFLIFINVRLNLLFKFNKNRSINREQNSQQRISQLGFQKILSKILVTLQPNFLNSLRSSGLTRLGSFYLMLMKSIPEEKRKDYYEQLLLKPIRELLKRNLSCDFYEIILKLLFAMIHLESSSNRNQFEENNKIASSLQKIITVNVIQDETKTRKDFQALILCYFNELIDLLRNRNDKSILLFHLDEFIGQLDLISLWKRLYSFQTLQTDRIIIMEFFNQSILRLNAFITSSKKIFTNEFQSTQDLEVRCQNENFFHQSIEKIGENLNRIINSLVEIIKMEISNNFSDDIIANLAFNITLINFNL